MRTHGRRRTLVTQWRTFVSVFFQLNRPTQDSCTCSTFPVLLRACMPRAKPDPLAIKAHAQPHTITATCSQSSTLTPTSRAFIRPHTPRYLRSRWLPTRRRALKVPPPPKASAKKHKSSKDKRAANVDKETQARNVRRKRVPRSTNLPKARAPRTSTRKLGSGGAPSAAPKGHSQ